MSYDEDRLCLCGSGLNSHMLMDGRGIYLCRVCAKCEQRKRAQYRPVIFTSYTQADVDEPIEEEDWRG
jgi:hypothetical protein